MHIITGLQLLTTFNLKLSCDVEQANRCACCRNAVCSEASRSSGVADGNGCGNERLQRPVFITQSYLVILHLLKRTQLRPDGLVSLSRGNDNAAYLSLSLWDKNNVGILKNQLQRVRQFGFFLSISFSSLLMCNVS